MRRILWVAVSLACAPLGAFGQEHGHGGEEKGGKAEIRVYLADQAKKPVDLTGITATVIVEPVGGKKRVLRTEVVTPKGSSKKGIGHGGEVRSAEKYFVEFVVVKPHEHEGGHDEGEEQTKDATPYFRVALEPLDPKFAAVVIVRIGDKTFNVKGFEHPPAVPNDYAGAVGRFEEHLAAIQVLIDHDDLESVHAIAEKISYVCEKLPDLASRDDRAEVGKTCKIVIGLFREIDAAADAGHKRETIDVLVKYKKNLAELQKHAKKGDHDHQ